MFLLIFYLILIAVILYDADREIKANSLIGCAGARTLKDWLKENTWKTVMIVVLSLLAINEAFVIICCGGC